MNGTPESNLTRIEVNLKNSKMGKIQKKEFRNKIR